ncbi:MAG: PadR family transcriptional regulator [Anaerolineales bacterium]|nr:PadR family transcriptional regulator [Anaerolineales bacterium]
MKNAEIALLGLLAEQPSHGYQIEQLIEERGMRDWTDIGFSSIYYLLNKLEKAGLIQSSLKQPQGQGPARKQYSLLPSGYSALREAVLESLSQPYRCYPPLQLGLANLPMLEPGEAAAALHAHQQALEAQLTELQRTRLNQQPLPYHVEKMFEHSQTLIEAELDWLRKVHSELEESDEKNRF